MHLGHVAHVRRPRQIVALHHVGDFEKLRDAGQANHVRLHVVHRAGMNKLAEMRGCVDLFAERDRCLAKGKGLKTSLSGLFSRF